MKLSYNKGFTLAEMLIVLTIISIMAIIVMNTFVDVRKSEALNKDTETIVETLRQARSETLSSQNSSQYGVHILSTMATIYTGSVYSSSDPTNRDYPLSSNDTIITISLNGGGSDVVFNRLTGETAQNGSVVISSPTTSKTKTVTIYKTGLVESN